MIDDLSRGELIALAGRLFAQVQELTRVNAELVEANAALTDRVARLERIVSRNSRNSGTPPSKDDDLGRAPPADEPGTTGGGPPRKRGKRKGAPGAHLAWSPDPNTTLDHFPQGVRGCGSDLTGAADLGVYAAHQQVGVPLMTATVTQHDRHAVRCRCGAMHIADRPEGVADASVSFGPNLVSWCVYLMVAHAVPVARCADLVAALTGTRPSDGFVHSLLGRAAAAVAETNRMELVTTDLRIPPTSNQAERDLRPITHSHQRLRHGVALNTYVDDPG